MLPALTFTPDWRRHDDGQLPRFLAAIQADPHDEAPVLIFYDWLMDWGATLEDVIRLYAPDPVLGLREREEVDCAKAVALCRETLGTEEINPEAARADPWNKIGPGQTPTVRHIEQALRIGNMAPPWMQKAIDGATAPAEVMPHPAAELLLTTYLTNAGDTERAAKVARRKKPDVQRFVQMVAEYEFTHHLMETNQTWLTWVSSHAAETPFGVAADAMARFADHPSVKRIAALARRSVERDCRRAVLAAFADVKIERHHEISEADLALYGNEWKARDATVTALRRAGFVGRPGGRTLQAQVLRGRLGAEVVVTHDQASRSRRYYQEIPAALLLHEPAVLDQQATMPQVRETAPPPWLRQIFPDAAFADVACDYPPDDRPPWTVALCPCQAAQLTYQSYVLSNVPYRPQGLTRLEQHTGHTGAVLETRLAGMCPICHVVLWTAARHSAPTP